MYKFVFILILSATQLAHAQHNKDKIEVHQGFGGSKYSVGGKSISMKQMKTLMQYDESAYVQFKSGRAYNTAATVLGATGGVLIAINVGVALANGSTNGSNGGVKWGMAIAGGVLVLITIPISITGTKRINNAIEIYNANLTLQSYQKSKPEFRFGFTGSGIGLMIKI